MNNFTNIHKIIDGCLLGDGHLEYKDNKNYNSCLSYGSSVKEHTEYIHQFFKEYCNENYREIKRSEIFDKRTNKTYVRYWFRTKCLPIFTEQRKRFYSNGLKIIPRDLEINEVLLLFWYIGDGELESKNGYIKLHTNSFTLSDVNFLISKLKNFEAKISKKVENQYIISIPRKCVKLFLKYIGNCPIKNYKHKWVFVDYKNKNIELNGIQNYSDVYPIIVNDFLSGNFTIYQLYKKYNVPINAIKNNFDRNGINWKPVVNKKKIIQYNIEGKELEIWECGQDISKKLNFNASAISECCRGKRKTYKNYIWKFKN